MPHDPISDNETTVTCYPVIICRVYDAFSLEAILSVGFGRQVDIQLGESDEFAKAMNAVVAVFTGGQIEGFFLLNSKIKLGSISISLLQASTVSHKVSSSQG